MAIIYQDGKPGKVCTKCKTWKPVERIRKRAALRDGYDSVCRDCLNAASREWRKNNRERVSQLNREFYEANREERKAYHRQYRQDHLEHMRILGRKYRRENGKYFRDYMRQWSRANPDKIRTRDYARRSRKKGNGGSFTVAEWEQLKKLYNYTCLRCKKQEPEIKLTIDHIVPLSKGGCHSIENVQPLCQSCNSAKWNKTVDYRPEWNK